MNDNDRRLATRAKEMIDGGRAAPNGAVAICAKIGHTFDAPAIRFPMRVRCARCRAKITRKIRRPRGR